MAPEMPPPRLDTRSIVELWRQRLETITRNEEYMQGYPHGPLSDPDRIETDPNMAPSDHDTTMSDWIITSPVNPPCTVSDSGLDIPDDISMHPVEDFCAANQEHLLDDAQSDFFAAGESEFFAMGEYLHNLYTQHHDPTKKVLFRLRPRSLGAHIFNALSFQKDSASTNSEPVTETIPSEPIIEGQEDHEMEEGNMSGDPFTNYNIKMMFVSGETAEPSPETTTLIEEITRQQVIEILSRSTALATRRGVRSISTDDLIFLIRHDKAKVSRLRTFLSWKDVRKNVKDSDDKGGGDAADFAAADDAAGVVAGPQDVAPKPKNKRAKVGLAWDVNSFYSVQVPEREDEEDEEEEEQNYATLQRLAAADERTRHMTREEYVFWSECRQASFTYRKSKRFREWAGFGIVTESKPNDDIVDILGFLTFEIVQTLTEQALKVKEREDNEKHRRGGAEAGENLKKRKRETGLFDPPRGGTHSH
ncbi:Histone-fold [Penicillium fimorum]|uniref:Histone-fold n=1 Tax=Penicillium fimorum TaxID=1882269 RepID=A0A9W9Y4M2_9EURO|nr:Histone-fold [Penicillium fimorum]